MGGRSGVSVTAIALCASKAEQHACAWRHSSVCPRGVPAAAAPSLISGIALVPNIYRLSPGEWWRLAQKCAAVLLSYLQA